MSKLNALKELFGSPLEECMGWNKSFLDFFFFCDSMDSLVRVSIVYTGKNNYYKLTSSINDQKQSRYAKVRS